MIDHVGFAVTDFARSKAFPLAALAPLGNGLVMEVGPEQTGAGAHAGFGEGRKPGFWISSGSALSGTLHVCLQARSRAAVDAFHAAALAAGARDNGTPGLRPHYHPDYYGAFVLDPDDHNIEAACHLPQEASP